MHFPLRILGCGFVASAVIGARAQTITDPHITTWLTAKSAQYARVYETASDKSSGNAVSTWPRTGLTNSGGGQATAAYADVQRVAYSASNVYIYTTGLASYAMGNWLTPQGGVFMFWPENRAAIHKIPRIAAIPTTKANAKGVGGVWVNGVYLWENGDAQSYSTSTGQVSMGGDGIWNRLAGAAEAFNFDPANGHQPGSGAYHTHINPIGLRYQLGDNVSYNASTKTYAESAPTHHSPILGWALDGLPVYGPYGYASAMDASSAIRRMTTGFQKRDGTNGATNLASSGRHSLPAWAAVVQNKGTTETALSSSQYGPPVNGSEPLGTFAEDYDYLGDRGKTQGVDFDLNAQNVRFCVTPEYPNGTYAYFVSIDASGATAFPDVINQQFFGSVSGAGPQEQGTVNSIAESVTDYVDAGPAAVVAVTATASGNGVRLSWNSAEGATYKVESSSDNSTWAALSSAITSGGLTTTYTAGATANYFRITLTAIATYDSGGTFGTAVGKTGSVQFGIPTVAAPTIATPPSNLTVTVGAAASFTVAAGGTGPLTYQWQKNGSAIAGATSTTYAIASAQISDAGNFTVIVANAGGSVTSSAAVLSVTTAPVAPAIVTPPANVTANVGGAVTFTVVASGTAPLSYQWKKNGAIIVGADGVTYRIPLVTLSDGGDFSCVVSNAIGSVTSAAATLTVTTNAIAPAITVQPANVSTILGTAVSFSVVASGTAPLTYQWQKNGAPIAGATSPLFGLANVQPADAGSFDCVVANAAGATTSSVAALTVNVVVTPAARIINLAVRSRVGGIAGSPTTGFVMSGAGAGKRVIVRAVGPTLAAFGVAGALADPKLDLIGGGATIASNDNWLAPDDVAFQSVGAFALGPNAADAAIVATLAPGAYTTPVSIASGSGGIVLLECYDGAPADTSVRLINASALAYVGSGDDVLIPGFVISGDGTVKVLLRAVGTGLAAFGVGGTLPAPQMTLFSGATALADNHDWGSSANADAIATAAGAVGAFPLARNSGDAALLVSLSAGAYSATVSGVGGATGTALVEVYVVP